MSANTASRAPEATPAAPIATRTTKSKRKSADAAQSHRSISEQTAAFLAAGGHIETIPSGVSGQLSLNGPRYTPQKQKAKEETAAELG